MGNRVVIVGQYMEGIEIERGILEPIGAEIVDTRDFSEEETNEAMRTADAVLFRKLGVTRELINSLDIARSSAPTRRATTPSTSRRPPNARSWWPTRPATAMTRWPTIP